MFGRVISPHVCSKRQKRCRESPKRTVTLLAIFGRVHRCSLAIFGCGVAHGRWGPQLRMAGRPLDSDAVTTHLRPSGRSAMHAAMPQTPQGCPNDDLEEHLRRPT